MSVKVLATNRKARHEYFLLDTYEAGIALLGSEIKSIRAGQISIKEAYIRVDGEEAWLVEAHVAPYDHANRNNHEPRRPRKLLLHKKEIKRLGDGVRKKGATIIPTRVYLKERARQGGDRIARAGNGNLINARRSLNGTLKEKSSVK